MVCAVALNACSDSDAASGPDGRGASPGQPGPAGAAPSRTAVRDAADTLTRAGTSRTRTAVRTVSGGTRVTVDGKGAFDFRKRTGRLTLRLPVGTSGARPGERRVVRELVTPGALYLKNRGGGVPPDKWVRVRTAELRDGNLVTGGATDPVSASELLRGARQVRFQSARRLSGERVWGYSGVVDLERAAATAYPAWRAQLASAAKGFSERSVPFDAYLDGQGRLRKVQYRFRVAGMAGGVTSTTVLFGFGEPVNVTMPPEGEIHLGRIAQP
ncbi:hypothetical protein E0L36_23995 [Streptomyces sp. AJS327]|nr:hypothetical protein [Streptomyces sp. AJS327]